MSRILIFAGPTLSHERIRALVPASEIYPPIAAGDLIRLSPGRGDLVVIIDGFFYQSASVRHKEILDLLRQGVHVWGAASMGALRAAELAAFGMRGFGQIFEAYKRGEIEGDDEVAIIHAPEDMGYTSLTEALVNIRYACARAANASILPDISTHNILNVATNLPFYERTYPNILKRATEHALSQQDAEAFRAFLQQEHPNLKQQDALALLDALPTSVPEPSETSFEWHATSLVQSWYINEKGTYIDDKQFISESDVLAAFQLFNPDYPVLHHQVLLRLLVTLAAPSLTDQPASPETRCVQTAAHYIAARCTLDLRQALPRTMLKWLYPAEAALPQEEQLVNIAIRLWFDPRGLDWREAVIAEMKERDLFQHWQRFVSAAYAFNRDIWGKNAVSRCYALNTEIVCAWFKQRWGVAEEDFELALLDRGFCGCDDFFERVCFFYLFDKYVGVDHWQKQLVQS